MDIDEHDHRDSCNQIDHTFLNLFQPKLGSSLPVTLMSCSSILLAEEEATLYAFIAGTTERPIQFRHDSYHIKSKTVFDDDLHEQIRVQCEVDLLSRVDEITRHKLEKETPCFVITDKIPILGDYPINFASMRPAPERLDGKLSFKYAHRGHPHLYIRVFEPASPSKVDIYFSDDTKLSTNLKQPADIEKVRHQLSVPIHKT